MLKKKKRTINLGFYIQRKFHSDIRVNKDILRFKEKDKEIGAPRIMGVTWRLRRNSEVHSLGSQLVQQLHLIITQENASPPPHLATKLLIMAYFNQNIESTSQKEITRYTKRQKMCLKRLNKHQNQNQLWQEC